jgi:hypothetical protein
MRGPTLRVESRVREQGVVGMEESLFGARRQRGDLIDGPHGNEVLDTRAERARHCHPGLADPALGLVPLVRVGGVETVAGQKADRNPKSVVRRQCEPGPILLRGNGNGRRLQARRHTRNHHVGVSVPPNLLSERRTSSAQHRESDEQLGTAPHCTETCEAHDRPSATTENTV